MILTEASFLCINSIFKLNFRCKVFRELSDEDNELLLQLNTVTLFNTSETKSCGMYSRGGNQFKYVSIISHNLGFENTCPPDVTSTTAAVQKLDFKTIDLGITRLYNCRVASKHLKRSTKKIDPATISLCSLNACVTYKNFLLYGDRKVFSQ